MTAFVDTAVLMYAAGGAHPFREPSRRILELVAEGSLDYFTSAEVIQEIIHRFVSIGRPEIAARLSSDALELFAPVLPITHAVVRRLPDLVRRYPELAARDLVHVATCQHEGIVEIISPDCGFDSVAGLHRRDLGEFA